MDFPFMPSVLTSSELVVEEEPFYEKSSLEDRERLTTTMFQEQCDNDDNSDDDACAGSGAGIGAAVGAAVCLK